MKVYLAGPWARREEVATVGERFEAAGHTITEKWWLHEPSNDHDELVRQATLDIEGVLTAGLFVVLQLEQSEGKAVETGLAIAGMIPIVVINPTGERGDTDAVRVGNMFHHLLKVYPKVDDAIEIANTLQREYEAWALQTHRESTQRTEGGNSGNKG